MIDIKMFKDANLKGYTLIDAFPGAGLVGSMAGSYMIEKLGMDARKSLSSIAGDTGISKTTVFNELNRLISEKEISFVPEINLEDMWRHEMLYTTKRMHKALAFEKLVMLRIPHVEVPYPDVA